MTRPSSQWLTVFAWKRRWRRVQNPFPAPDEVHGEWYVPWEEEGRGRKALKGAADPS